MYRRSTPGQLSFENFYLPFGGKLSGENRWVKLAQLIPWEAFEAKYAEQLSEDMGAPAKSFRMALGALIIKERLGTSDIETVEQIREKPYLQFFLGLSEYSDKAPFEASTLVHFRKRVNRELIGQLNEAIVHQSCQNNSPQQEDSANPSVEKGEDNDDHEPPSAANAGQLIVDASCTPADIRYPTDLSLLNEARERGIRLSRKPLGRPKQSEQAQLQKQAKADAAIRNQVEGKFGVSKRRFSLARVMAKLAPTAETAIAMTFLVMNLEQLLRQLLFVFFAVFLPQEVFQFNRWQRQWRDPQFALAAA